MYSDFENSIEEWSYFTCIDVGTEVFTPHVGELCEAFECMAYVDQIWFNPSDRFFIDEVFIAQDEIHCKYNNLISFCNPFFDEATRVYYSKLRSLLVGSIPCHVLILWKDQGLG